MHLLVLLSFCNSQEALLSFPLLQNQPQIGYRARAQRRAILRLPSAALFVYLGTGYPCHPYCQAVDEDEKFREVASSTEEQTKQFSLKRCLKYRRKKLALTLALLLKAAIGISVHP